MPDNLTEDLLLVREKLATFIRDEIQPREQRIDGHNLIDLQSEVRKASKAAGFFYKTQPKEFGGQPVSMLELTMIREMLAASNTRLANVVFGPGPGILHGADGELKANYLEPLMRGEKQGAFGFTEADAAMRPTFAVLKGDQLTITGHKSYVTGGLEADFVSILVNVEDESGGKLGTAMVVVDMALPGVSVEHEFQSMEGGGHISIAYNQVQVSTSHVIGKIGEGMPRALGNIGNVRLMVSAQAMGMCQYVLELVEQHLLAPHRSGSPLGEKQGVRMRFADMRIETFVARSALYRAARIVDSGDNSVNETIAAKVFCTETAGRVVDMGVQLLGGQALVQGHPLEKLYRQVRSQRLIEGASDLLRLNLSKGRLELGKGRI